MQTNHFRQISKKSNLKPSAKKYYKYSHDCNQVF